MHSILLLRPHSAPERVILSRLIRFWPWLAASVAIHGLLLVFWLGKSPDSAANPAEGVVIELVSIDAAAEKSTTQPIPAALPVPKKVVVRHPAQKASPAITVVKKVVPVFSQASARIQNMPEQPSTQPTQLADNRKISPKPLAQSVASHQATGDKAVRASKKTDVDKSQLLIRKHLESFKYYPASARRRGIEGHVEVGFTLTRDGAADQVSVLHGSGYAVLDHAALETVYRAQPFPIENGKYRFSLRFKQL